MSIAIVCIKRENSIKPLKQFVKSINGTVRIIDEEILKERMMSVLLDEAIKDGEIIPEEIVRKDFKEHGIDL